MSNKKRGVSNTNFTDLTFDEIKEKLVNRAKNYYPDTYQDFNKSSFGSLMMDTVAMIGEQLNFYTQFVANENFLETSRTAQGITSAARNSGIEIFNKYTSVGNIKIYSRIPAMPTLSNPDQSYRHTILKGMIVTNDSGAQYTTTEDVVVDASSVNQVGTEFSDDGSRITYYVYETEVPVVSGENRIITVDVGSYQKFLKVEIKDTTITEIISVVDENQNEYLEVKNLSQDTVYKELSDRVNNSSETVSRLVPIQAPRRFTVQHVGERTFLVFGFGSENNLKTTNIADPTEIALQVDGRNYVNDNVFDPSKLLKTDKFGVSPENTTLTITYRSSTVENSNAAARTLNNIISSEILFNDENSLNSSKVQYIKNSLTCENEEPINGSLTFGSTQEVVETIKSARGFRGRAVTVEDYVAACYAMPSKFGSVKRVAVYRDQNDYKRNLNLYLIAQDSLGFLQTSSTALKNNLKKWLNSVRMITDTIDIFDAKILNLAIFFDVTLKTKNDQLTILSEIRKKVYEEINLTTAQVGQHFSIGDIEKIILSIPVVDRVNSVTISNKQGEAYSNINYDIGSNLSPDGGMLYLPENFIYEIKNESDITGIIQ
jgi:hypothetical protein